MFQFVKTWNISRTKRVRLVKVIVRTGHLVKNQLEDVITDVKITGWANFARVKIFFFILFYIILHLLPFSLLRCHLHNIID